MVTPYVVGLVAIIIGVWIAANRRRLGGEVRDVVELMKADDEEEAGLD